MHRTTRADPSYALSDTECEKSGTFRHGRGPARRQLRGGSSASPPAARRPEISSWRQPAALDRAEQHLAVGDVQRHGFERPDARAEDLHEPAAGRDCRRDRRRRRRSIGVEPRDRELDRAPLGGGERQALGQRAVISIVERERDDACAEVDLPPSDHRHGMAARRQRAGKPGEHAGAADHEHVTRLLEQRQLRGGVDVRQQTLLQHNSVLLTPRSDSSPAASRRSSSGNIARV